MLTLYAIAFDCRTGTPICIKPAHSCDIRYEAAKVARAGQLWAVRYGYASTDSSSPALDGLDVLYEGPAACADLPYIKICAESVLQSNQVVSSLIADTSFELTCARGADSLYSVSHGLVANVVPSGAGWAVRLADASVYSEHPTRAAARSATWDQRRAIAVEVGQYAAARRK